MSGFTRDPLHYGEHLVYEALVSRWSRYHQRCGCGRDWVAAHAVPAGLTVVRKGNGFVALTGPGLTEDVDESRLTSDVLWRAVTGTEAQQEWSEPVRVIDRPVLSAEQEQQRKTANRARYAEQRRRSAQAQVEPLTGPQRAYLENLVANVSRERFDDAVTQAIEGSSVAVPFPGEKTLDVIERLTKATARELITALKEER